MRKYEYIVRNFLVSIFVLSALVILSPLFLNLYLSRVIAFSDAHVIATFETIGMIWMTPLFLHIMFPVVSLYRWHFPIDRWGRHPWERDFYESRSQKRRRRQKKFLLWLIGFIFFSLLFCLSLSGRICMTDDGRIQRYNVWNQLTEEIAPEDITTVIFDTQRKSKKYGLGDYYYSVKFLDTEENDYWFPRKGFRFSDKNILQSLLDIKSLYAPEQIVVKDVETLKEVVQDCELSEEETVLLYTLFDAINQPT